VALVLALNGRCLSEISVAGEQLALVGCCVGVRLTLWLKVVCMFNVGVELDIGGCGSSAPEKSQ